VGYTSYSYESGGSPDTTNRDASPKPDKEAMKDSSLKELRQQFIDLGGDADLKLRSKAQAIEAIEALSADTPVEATVAPTPAPKSRTRKPMNWPPSDDGVRAHRLGTKRALVVDMLTSDEGATFSEVQDAIAENFGVDAAWNDRTCYEGIKLINAHLGYGLRQDPETGKIQAFVAA